MIMIHNTETLAREYIPWIYALKTAKSIADNVMIKTSRFYCNLKQTDSYVT